MTDDDPEPIRRGREVLGRPVADFASPVEGWQLLLQCAGVCRMQQRQVTNLVPYLPPGLTWAELLPKLRCSRCQEAASLIGLCGPPIASDGGRRAWLMLRLGPGPWLT